MDVNLSKRIAYIAALGNNTLEVVDLLNGKVIQSEPNPSEGSTNEYQFVTYDTILKSGLQNP